MDTRFSKIIITGGCGAIGSEVVNRLKSQYPSIQFVILDNLTYAGKKENIEPPYDNYKFVYGDICDAKFVSYLMNTEKPDGIIHLAAETHVDNSFGNSFQFTKTNVLGTHVLLECVRQYMSSGNTFHLFLHMSTDEVYGSVKDDQPACKEDALFFPSNPYSATKAAAEMICHAYMKSFKVPILITRCNNAVSKYQNEEKLIPRCIHNILSGKKVPVHGDGMSKRTFIHAFDIADALDILMTRGDVDRVYNIGCDDSMEKTVLSVIEHILGVLKPSEKLEDWVEFVADRAFQDYRYAVDTTDLKNLGWSLKRSFDYAVNDVIDHLFPKIVKRT